MKVLVTGGAGFVARHLAAELASGGNEVWLSDCLDVALPNYRRADLADEADVRGLVAEVRPEAVVHLGAISFVPDAAKDPSLLERVNVGGTRNLLEALLAVDMPRFLFASTAQVCLKNPSAYAESKMAGEGLVLHAFREGGDAFVARPANHTGPGQSDRFVVPSFIRQAREIKSGRRRCFTVGNLDSVRDFTDVRDVARAYRIMLERAKPGEVYAIGSPVRLSMRELLGKVADAVGVPCDYEVDASLWRPADASPELDTSAIRELGWQPQFTLDDTLADMIGLPPG